STGNAPSALVADHSGNVFVAGYGQKAVITGYDSRNKPIYTNVNHWLVRKSANGGASWSNDDDFQLTSLKNASASAIGTDFAGNVYVAGVAGDDSAALHAIVRSNTGASWTTSDDYFGMASARYQGFTTDSSGTLYALGRSGGGATQNFFIRSAPNPAA